ncbi:MAG: Mce-associated membrane protein [Rhodococcus sp. (in: high G+C Gram-positive bacteria)]|jgi:Mce-associated membrane protein
MANTIRLTEEPDTKVHSDAALEEAAKIERRRTRSRFVTPSLVAVLALVIIIAAVVGTLSARAANRASEADARDQHIVDIASGMAVNLVTLGKDSADADLSRVIDGTTGDFREQFVSAAGGFGALLTEGGVESVGEVKAVGIVDSNEEAATVLAAVTSTVKNNEAPGGEVRVYRMKLTVTAVGSTWLVSNVEFVA